MVKYNYGDVVRTDYFPFEEGNCGKARYVFVLEEQGGVVLAAYLTGNPDGAVRLGKLDDDKVTNLIPSRVALLHKDTLSRKVQRVEFAHCLRAIIVAARAGCYGYASSRIAEETIRQSQYAQRRLEKKLAKAGSK